MSDRTRSALLSSGLLSAPHHGVLAPAGVPDLLRQAQAAALVLPSGGAIGRRTAAQLLGVDPRAPHERGALLEVECLVPTGCTPLRRPGLRSFTTDLPSDEIDLRFGLPATIPERTAADLLRWLAPYMAIAVLDRMAALDLLELRRVAVILDRWDGHRNVARARQLLSMVDPRAESYGESWLRLRILDAGFPCPEAQIAIEDGGRVVYRLDLGWRQLRVGAEYDGEEFHSGRAALRHDHERRSDLLTRFDWNVIGFGKAMVLGPPAQLEHGLAQMLGVSPAAGPRIWRPETCA